MKGKYSQNAEDFFVVEHLQFKQRGKFIDIGSYDAVRFSNVRALFELGVWEGIMVEPAPSNFAGIKKFYENEPKIQVLNFAVGSENGEIDFYESGGDAVSTSDLGHAEKWGAAGVKYTKIKVQQISVEDFFEQYGHGVDMLSIDTESTNIDVFRRIPDWVWRNLSLLVIEHDTYIEEITSSLSKYGFREVYTNAENIILVK